MCGSNAEEGGVQPPERVDWRILSSKVIAVAQKGYRDDWAAYIDAVPGINHKEEILGVLEHGTKLDKKLAEALFPDLDIAKYRM